MKAFENSRTRLTHLGALTHVLWGSGETGAGGGNGHPPGEHRLLSHSFID